MRNVKLGLTERDKELIRKIYAVLDPKQKGTISLREACMGIQALNQPLTPDEVEQIRAIANNGHKPAGTITMAEFIHICSTKLSERTIEDEATKLFHLFSSDGTTVTIDDVRRKAVEVNEILSEDELQVMIDQADIDDDGIITLEDFVILVARIHRRKLQGRL